jgi:hypothetical protein
VYWTPNVAPIDGHDDAFEAGDGPPDVAELPPNIVGGDVGEIGAEFTDYSSEDFGLTPDNIVLGDE